MRSHRRESGRVPVPPSSRADGAYPATPLNCVGTISRSSLAPVPVKPGHPNPRSSDYSIPLFDVLPGFNRTKPLAVVPRASRRGAVVVRRAALVPAQPGPPTIDVEPVRTGGRWDWLIRHPMAMVAGLLTGMVMTAAYFLVDVKIDRSTALVTITVWNGAEPEPPKPDSTMKHALAGCVGGATKGALTAAVPAAELALTGVLSPVSLVLVLTASGVGCGVGAMTDTAKLTTKAAIDDSRWF